jgi:hypothetical protein
MNEDYRSLIFIMKRRDFILMGTAGLTAVAIPSAYYYFRDIEFDPSLAEPSALYLIWDKDAIIAIGKQYRTQVPDENSKGTLARELYRDAPEEKKQLNIFIEEKIKDDFKSNTTITVDGWILSATEARQCALLSTLVPTS